MPSTVDTFSGSRRKRSAAASRDYSRRQMLGLAGSLGLAGAVMAACGSNSSTSSSAQGSGIVSAFKAGPDPAKAKEEGTLVLWHADQEDDVVEFLKKFTEKTGIQATQQRAESATVIPKLQQGMKAGIDADVYNGSSIATFLRLKKADLLYRYVSDEMDAYDENNKSDPPGFWTTYYINDGPIMYIPTSVQDGPQSYEDLLNPEWKGGLCFQDATAGTQYTWWYLLREHLDKNYWDELASQSPTAYPSSTAQMQQLYNGNEKIGGKVSSFQYAKAKREGRPIEAVYPAVGVPTATQSSMILRSTTRPNASMMFIDYILSQEGQTVWNNIQGSHSARSDVKTKYATDITNKKLLYVSPKKYEDFASDARGKEFRDLWTKITSS